jgi:ectoine hydroxylase-related dioxygenase (phytanoyl-CoA dioxygenase family)
MASLTGASASVTGTASVTGKSVSVTGTASVTGTSATEQLNTKGYAIIENVLTAEQVATATQYFREWLAENPIVLEKHKKIDPHGIFKFAEVGHQKHAWYIKTLPNVQKQFKELWGTEELVTGFDGSCLIQKDFKGKEKIWTHTDQAPDTKGRVCVQGFVALTTNEERTIRVYEGSHLLHEQYMRAKGLTGKKNWQLIEHDYLEAIKDKKRVLKVKAGSLVLWDSRTFHQNQYGNPGEERIVQYVCFLPKNHKQNTKTQHEKRVKYYEERRTTSHWPYPVHVNGLQPRTYGNTDLLMDYDELTKPDLREFDERIRQII